MSSKNPIVSLIMPVHNGEPFLKEALAGIESQTFKNFESIIVNDASNDGTRKILENFLNARSGNTIVINNSTKQGVTRSLNRAVAIAKGRLIARQDADDVSLPERLAQQVKYMKTHPRVGLLGTFATAIDAQGNHLHQIGYCSTHTAIRANLLRGFNSFVHSSVIMRRACLEKAGLYDESLLYGQDYDLWFRMLEITHGANIIQPLILYRVHKNSLSNLRMKEQRETGVKTTIRELRKIVPEMNPDAALVRGLRGLQDSFFENGPTSKNMEILRFYLAIIDALRRETDMDENELDKIRAHWIDTAVGSTMMEPYNALIKPVKFLDSQSAGFSEQLFPMCRGILKKLEYEYGNRLLRGLERSAMKPEYSFKIKYMRARIAIHLKTFERIVLFPAGKHTGWLLKIAGDILRPDNTILCDENPDFQLFFPDYKRLTPNAPEVTEAKCVLLSASPKSKTARKRAKQLFGKKLADIYDENLR